MRSPKSTFPVTRHSAVLATRSENQQERERAYETILLAYWKPSYKYIRLKWSAGKEDSEDLTQSFFTKAFEKGYFEKYDHTIGSFHAFLRVCIDRFVANDRKASGRKKSGGGSLQVFLDFPAAENEFRGQEIANELSMEDYFHREWVRSLLTMSVETLRDKCNSAGKQLHLQLFELYDLEDEGEKLSYEALGRRFGLKSSDVTNYLAFARREFRKIVLDKLREITATDEEFRTEARMLLGVDIK